MNQGIGEFARRWAAVEQRATAAVAERHAAVDIMVTLAERGGSHGPFADNAAVSQAIKRVFASARGFDRLGEVHREALDMIALKLSRIVTGHADHIDHWHDIEGYARLASLACRGSAEGAR